MSANKLRYKEAGGGDVVVPLVNSAASNNGNGDLMRMTSCLQDTRTWVLDSVLAGNTEDLSSRLAEVAPMGDDEVLENGGTLHTLPDDHWINQPTGKEGAFRTLLQIAVDNGDIKIVNLLLRAGARADRHNDDLGLAPIHNAVLSNHLDIVKELCRNRVNKANVNARMRNGKTPLHLASEAGFFDVVKFLLNNAVIENIDAEDLNGRQTPLFLAVKNNHLSCVRLLLEHGASLLTTVGGKNIRQHISSKLPHFNPDSVDLKVKAKESDTRDLLYSLSATLDKAQVAKMRGKSNIPNLENFTTVLLALTTSGNTDAINRYSAGQHTLVQKACQYNLPEFLNQLLQAGVDSDYTIEENSTKPILTAAYHGNHEIIDILLKYKCATAPSSKVSLTVQENITKETVLHYILKKSKRLENDETAESDYAKCLDLILESTNKIVLEEISRIINRKDCEGNTPLHYATLLWSQATVRKLLELGAHVGSLNKWSETPISRIQPDVMENFLDDFCINSKNDVEKEDFELTFRYSFLAPPVNHASFDETDAEGQEMVEKAALPETETLWYMAQSNRHRHLLKHPVIASFLWMKWQRIRKHFNRNIRLYLLFVTVLTWYIFERFGGISFKMVASDNGANTTSVEDVIENKTRGNSEFCQGLRDTGERNGFWFVVFILQTCIQMVLIIGDWYRDTREANWKSALMVFLSSWIEFFILVSCAIIIILGLDSLTVILIILLGLVTFRELLQMAVSLKRYIFDLENILEMAMIGLVTVIVFFPEDLAGCDLKRHLAAICIVISWATLITLVGRHPKLSRYNIYVTMLYKVLTSFFLFLTWYSFLVIAFGLGFYIMLHKDVPNHIEEEDEYKFFNSPWLALVKTSTMFVGELEFSDLPIDTQSTTTWLSFIFFLSFLFLIVVVLMNLLNGLAVSDTGIIRDEAEIITHISRVDIISCTEAVLLGDPFNFLSNWPPVKAFRSLPSLALCRSLYRNNAVRDISHKITGATGILLFYSKLPSKQVTLHPNRSLSVCSCFASETMGPEIIQAAKQIILRKQKASEESDPISEVMTRLKQLEDNQNKLLASFDNICNKLDDMSRRMANQSTITY